MTKDLRNGSVLLEALLAVVILAAGLSIMVQSMAQNLKIASQTVVHSQAVFLADEAMFHILKGRYAPQEGFQAESKKGPLAWEASLTYPDQAVDERLSALQRVGVSVALAGEQRREVLDTEIFMIRRPDNIEQ
ncbi:MAG TPA: hypothetical protein P5246_06090 [Candidatus Omnitrophota bacterium]|jgi:Tfp pilus assembly protein PilV|nr:hypothetical protein [Candidatus Omnitrophota bacterium]HSA30607.1 hypothetical protein [Candidatus Omnitrophota bacterium]